MRRSLETADMMLAATAASATMTSRAMSSPPPRSLWTTCVMRFIRFLLPNQGEDLSLADGLPSHARNVRERCSIRGGPHTVVEVGGQHRGDPVRDLAAGRIDAGGRKILGGRVPDRETAGVREVRGAVADDDVVDAVVVEVGVRETGREAPAHRLGHGSRHRERAAAVVLVVDEIARRVTGLRPDDDVV